MTSRRLVMRILTATPKAFLTANESDSSFFSRDMGLTCRALREAGVESQVVMLEGPEARAHPDVIRGSRSDLESADWWARLNPDAVVLCAWAAPRYTPIARAIRESGAVLIARCDSGEPYRVAENAPAVVSHPLSGGAIRGEGLGLGLRIFAFKNPALLSSVSL